MAWGCSGKTNVELINNMLGAGLFKSERVGEALRRVDRINYVRNKHEAYFDSPQSIGHAATISAPHMHAHAAEHLLPHLKPGGKVLDIGSGSGYTCAVFHHLVNPTGTEGGKVVGIEHISELVDWSIENLKRDGLGSFIENGLIKMICGDGRLGYASGGPYNVIHVGAAAPTMPQPLIDQLAKPGRMFIPGQRPVTYPSSSGVSS
ncbi:Protein-L-isoaspartate(D-aspartate) O-methyltransferase [Ceratobasidium theobromae]|uniref:Protein-L-isoaspartate O-methyltransferase n=1 Tax=Ceratobasidium theobromae TaxID=1582974 RepID=A0A5N5QQK1_9AGAM|nr:Protein-L-isoaspartate(D-aspartate) O-methyltransferase [Ceratobasidium theobromae]